MSNESINTLSGYLGQDFQQNLMWQILIEQEFGNRIINDLSAEYFDDPNYKRLIIILKEYHKEYDKVPNIQSKTIEIAINKYKKPNDVIEQESLFAIIDRIKIINEKIINGQIPYNGDVIQAETVTFIKQQEYRKLGEYILGKTKNGDIKKKQTLGEIEEKFNKISGIGDDENFGIKIRDNILHALRKEYRETIETGITVLDGVTGGGLGNGEVGIILTPSGVGKTTTLTKIANTAYNNGKKVLQIIFEDTEDQVSRKHFAIWSGIPLSEMDKSSDEVADRVYKKLKFLDTKGGDLVIKVFSQENTTMFDIRNWIIKYQKKNGYKFDIIILDYLDCLEPNKKSADRQESELSIIKSFLALAADYNVPCWSALQSNRGGFNAEFLDVEQMGGNVKRIQKSHFFMSIAKPNEHKDSSLVNVKILKARMVKDGQSFPNSILNNDTMEISFDDRSYENKYSKNGYKKSAADEMLRLQNTVEKANLVNLAHVAISSASDDDDTTIGDIVTIDGELVNKAEFAISSDIPIIDETINEEPNEPIIEEILKPVIEVIRDLEEMKGLMIDPDEMDETDRLMLFNKGLK